MKHLALILFLIPLISLSQKADNYKNYIAVGFLDHKTGTSFIGYSKSIIQNSHNELFVGFGTIIASSTFSIGVKKYLLKKSINYYSVVSMQSIFGMGGRVNAPAISIGVEKNITKKIFINLGLNSTIRFYSSRNTELITYPQINLNIRY